MKTFRFTQFHFNGQGIAIEANSEEEARRLILEGEGYLVGDEFFVRSAEDKMPMEAYGEQEKDCPNCGEAVLEDESRYCGEGALGCPECGFGFRQIPNTEDDEAEQYKTEKRASD